MFARWIIQSIHLNIIGSPNRNRNIDIVISFLVEERMTTDHIW